MSLFNASYFVSKSLLHSLPEALSFGCAHTSRISLKVLSSKFPPSGVPWQTAQTFTITIIRLIKVIYLHFYTPKKTGNYHCRAVSSLSPSSQPLYRKEDLACILIDINGIT